MKLTISLSDFVRRIGRSCRHSRSPRSGIVETLIAADRLTGFSRQVELLEDKCLLAADFGDAPDLGPGTQTGDYQTLSVNGGASHTIDVTQNTLFLGTGVDADDGLLQNSRANADDVDAALPDDENAVLSPLDLAATAGTSPTVTLLATNLTGVSATLSGWIDYNRDGVFDNSTERSQATIPDGTTNGRFTLTFPAIPVGLFGETYARFRLSADAAGQNSTGTASDGEVEDYVFSITKPSQGPLDGFQTIAIGTGGLPVSRGNLFGRAITTLGDLDGDGVVDLAVGARSDGLDSGFAGLVHVLFMNANGTVRSSTKIVSNANGGPTYSRSDNFGSSVATLGDLNGDGFPDLAVGASCDGTGGLCRGALYVLFLSADGTVKDFTKIASNTSGGPRLADGDRFGSSVANVGDLDGDGVVDLAVGAELDHGGGIRRGAVHLLFMNPDGTIKNTTEISSDTNGGPLLVNGSHFGNSVSAVGDLDRDGFADLAVGAPGQNNVGHGSVYLLHLNIDGTVKDSTRISDEFNGGPTLNFGDNFGSSVTSVGDLDGDGVTDLAVGAKGDRTGCDASGEVYIIFMNSDDTVGDISKIDRNTRGGPSIGQRNRFGNSVTNIGDLDGDGVTELAVGTYITDFTSEGAVYIQNLNGTVQLPSSGGDYEVQLDDDDLVVRAVGGVELYRKLADRVTGLTILGSDESETITIGAVTASFTIEGLGGDDRVVTSALMSNITFNGGSGDDQLDATGSPARIFFDGGSGDDQLDASGATSRVSFDGGGGDDVAVGSDQNDTMIGGFGNDVFVGNGGDDVLLGSAGSDTLNGGDGNDWLLGNGASNDVLTGGPGDDFLDGGAGGDVILEQMDANFTATATSLTGNGNDVISSIELLMLLGGVSNNLIDASNFNGRAILLGLGGDDTLIGGAFDDILLGSSGKDRLIGGAGNDVLRGQGGSGDVLTGGAGNDLLDGGAGNYVLNEAGDTDFVLTNTSLTGAGTDQHVSTERANLSGGASDNVIDASGFLGSVILSGLGGNDSLIGSSFDDTLSGGDGDDTLLSGGGRDSVLGGNGDDLVHGGGGHDTLSGGPGTDIIQGRSTNTLFEQLADGVNNFTLEEFIPANIREVIIEGNDLSNVIDASNWQGKSGVTIRGGGGHDTLIGTERSDRLEGGDGDDRLLSLSGDDTQLGEAGDDVLLGRDGRDVLFGGDGNDRLFGSQGPNTFSGGPGDDFITGAGGSILIEHAIGRQPLIVGADGVVGTDTINTFVRGILLQGNDQANEIDASSYSGRAPVTIVGGAGNDLLIGAQHATRLEGGDGDDMFVGQQRGDLLLGQAGDDVLNGGGGNDVLFGGDGNDNLRGHSGRDVILGESGNDTLFGVNGNDVLLGGDGDDLQNGGRGNDDLLGNDGDDSLEGGDGIDRFNSGLGNDVLVDIGLGESDTAFAFDLSAILAGLN